MLRDRFRGALIGTLVGDALGMPVEGWTMDAIRREHGEVREMLHSRRGAGTYTDDTQMTGALAEALLEAGSPGEADLDLVAKLFGEHFDPRRGYGGNSRKILAAIRSGEPWREAVGSRRLPGGSFANGAAMRVAPAALACFPDPEATARVAESQAAVTGHDHPEARFGARLQAVAVLECLMGGPDQPPPRPHRLLSLASLGWTGDPPVGFTRALRWIGENPDSEAEAAASELGTGLRATASVPAALWAFLAYPDDPEEAIVAAVGLGGDTDTIGAMAGALVGARIGASAMPERWLRAVEEGPHGPTGLRRLADAFLERVEDRAG